ncbi:hypothetical protein Pmani_003281 [Petrolisthes manimaculis]|uniref:Jouberin n=1 Tax=Petrolisthes manimaculis TaxID=1843537 RepID=A0AAE1QH35_9EUCA|nr:hypothetical protein Pmani_003281 [Petrolisthes manimaculis]
MFTTRVFFYTKSGSENDLCKRKSHTHHIISMTVEDEEPLTGAEPGGELEDEEEREADNSSEKLNTLLTSALHKHAATKLAKKLKKSKKSELTSEDATREKKERKDTKKKRKSTKSGGKKKDENVELQLINEAPGARKRSSLKNPHTPIKEENFGGEEIGEYENQGEEGEEKVLEQNKSVGELTPTRRYLAAVSVPKKRSRTVPRTTGAVLGVTVHAADRFQGSPLLLPHPLVQVYVVEYETGSLLNKTSREHRATSYYEAGRVDHILPIMTQPFHLSKARSVVCRWEEQLIINEPIHRFTSEEEPVMFFFQLMDFPGQAQGRSQAGWLTFAWAFLRVRGDNGRLNMGQRLRLQLWRPRRTSGVSLVDLYGWWKSGNRLKYPSTLYISLEEVTLPSCPAPALRSMLATQAEVGGDSVGTVQGSSSPASGCVPGSSSSQAKEVEVRWGRRPHQSCQLPVQIISRLPPAPRGNMVVRFSHNGLKLACGSHGPIRIFQIPGGNPDFTLQGHLGLVYDLCWGSSDNLLLSASADATARVWQLNPGTEEPFILTHPTFVYSAIFLPGGHVATGCYDHLVRVWCKKKGEYSRVQELTGHHGFITTLCLTNTNTQVLSGDSQGVIFVWDLEGVSEEVSKGQRGGRRVKFLQQEQRVVLSELAGAPINTLVPLPGGTRLLVHSRDNHLRLVCTRNWTVTLRMSGAVNVRQQLRGCITPCGSWVLAGSEDGTLHAWHSDTGQAALPLLSFLPGTISCVDYHPHDHLAAVTFSTPDTPVLLLGPQDCMQDTSPANPADIMYSQGDGGVLLGLGATSWNTQSPQKLPGSPAVPQNVGHSYRTPTPSLTSHPLTLSQLGQSQGSSQHLSHSSHHLHTQLSHTKQLTSTSIFSEEVVRWESDTRKLHYHKDSVLRKLDSVLKMVTLDPLNKSTADRLSSSPNPSTGATSSRNKVIAVPSTSGDVLFLSDPDTTPSKARARRHRVVK